MGVTSFKYIPFKSPNLRPLQNFVLKLTSLSGSNFAEVSIYSNCQNYFPFDN